MLYTQSLFQTSGRILNIALLPPTLLLTPPLPNRHTLPSLSTHLSPSLCSPSMSPLLSPLHSPLSIPLDMNLEATNPLFVLSLSPLSQFSALKNTLIELLSPRRPLKPKRRGRRKPKPQVEKRETEKEGRVGEGGGGGDRPLKPKRRGRRKPGMPRLANTDDGHFLLSPAL